MRSVLRLWALSLMLSVLLVAAGERWPDPLPVAPALVAVLVLLPPLLMLIWIAWHWSLPARAGHLPVGCSGEGGQSQNPESSEP